MCKSLKRLFIVTFTLVLLIGILYLFHSKKHAILPESAEICTLPRIVLHSYSGNIVDIPQQITHKRTVVLFFSPDCEHCEMEIADIINNRSVFDDVQWLFITQSCQKNELDLFLTKYKVDSLSNSIILLEEWPKYEKLFEVSGPPSIFVYNEKQKLVHSYRGSVEISTLINWLK